MKKVSFVMLVLLMSLNSKAQDTAAVIDYSVTLKEVDVFKTDKPKELQLGDSKKMFLLPEPQTTSWMLGRKFESQGDFKNLKKVIFYAKSAVDKGLCKVQIFAIGSNGLPAESLLSEEVLVEVKKGNQNLQEDNVILADSTLFDVFKTFGSSLFKTLSTNIYSYLIEDNNLNKDSISLLLDSDSFNKGKTFGFQKEI